MDLCSVSKADFLDSSHVLNVYLLKRANFDLLEMKFSKKTSYKQTSRFSNVSWLILDA